MMAFKIPKSNPFRAHQDFERKRPGFLSVLGEEAKGVAIRGAHSVFGSIGGAAMHGFLNHKPVKPNSSPAEALRADAHGMASDIDAVTKTVGEGYTKLSQAASALGAAVDAATKPNRPTQSGSSRTQSGLGKATSTTKSPPGAKAEEGNSLLKMLGLGEEGAIGAGAGLALLRVLGGVAVAGAAVGTAEYLGHMAQKKLLGPDFDKHDIFGGSAWSTIKKDFDEDIKGWKHLFGFGSDAAKPPQFGKLMYTATDTIRFKADKITFKAGWGAGQIRKPNWSGAKGQGDTRDPGSLPQYDPSSSTPGTYRGAGGQVVTVGPGGAVSVGPSGTRRGGGGRDDGGDGGNAGGGGGNRTESGRGLTNQQLPGVDPKLTESVRGGAVKAFGDPNDPNTRYVVAIQGGVRGEPGSKHATGDAVDVQIYDRETKQFIGGKGDIMKNAFGNPQTYRMYEVLAQARYQYILEKYGKEAADRSSWGGRFGQSKQGAGPDEMHYSQGEGGRLGSVTGEAAGNYSGPGGSIKEWLRQNGAEPSQGMGDDPSKWVSPYANSKTSKPAVTPGTQDDGNNPLKAERDRFAEELKNDPELRLRLAATMNMEEGGSHAGLRAGFESLMNRQAMHHGTIAGGISGGFYGPVNRGNLPAEVEKLRRSPEELKKINEAIDDALNGSNLTEGATDQGMPSDPNGGWRNPGSKVINGDVFNDFGSGGEKGHAAARKFREEQQGRFKAWQEQQKDQATTSPATPGPAASGPPAEIPAQATQSTPQQTATGKDSFTNTMWHHNEYNPNEDMRSKLWPSPDDQGQLPDQPGDALPAKDSDASLVPSAPELPSLQPGPAPSPIIVTPPDPPASAGQSTGTGWQSPAKVDGDEVPDNRTFNDAMGTDNGGD